MGLVEEMTTHLGLLWMFEDVPADMPCMRTMLAKAA